jgi:hypothetical protein
VSFAARKLLTGATDFLYIQSLYIFFVSCLSVLFYSLYYAVRAWKFGLRTIIAGYPALWM